MHSLIETATRFFGSSGGLQAIKDLMSSAVDITNLIFFQRINAFLNEEIKEFGVNLLGRTMEWVLLVGTVLATIWIMIQGFRIITGQSRDSMMALVVNSLKVSLIVGIASGWGLGGGATLFDWMGDGLQKNINLIVTGTDEDAYSNIDRSLGYMQLAFTSIDTLQDADNPMVGDAKSRAMWFTGIGTGGPAITAGVMLLLNKVAMALFTGLGPIFILCLLFDQTKSLFSRWLFYGIGTMFSLAVLSVMVALALDIVTAVAASFWVASFLGASSEGVNSRAMQQGGLGLILTMLIISAPPMAATFFQGTMGSFLAFSQFGGSAGTQQNARGPGSAPTTNSTYAGNSTAPNNSGGMRQVADDSGRYNNASQTMSAAVNTSRATGNAANTNQDAVRAGSNLPANYVNSPQSVAAERVLSGPMTPNNTALQAPTPDPASAAPAGSPQRPRGGGDNPTG